METKRKHTMSDIHAYDETGDFDQILIGSYLGDGCYLRINKHSRFSLAHSLKQKEYFMYKYKFFEYMGLEGKISEKQIFGERYKEGFFSEIRFKSKTNAIFDKYRSEGYGEDGNKCLNIKLIEDIKPLGLSIWFMDDGNRTNDSCEFNCQSFTENQKNSVKELLKDKFDINLNVTKNTIYVPKDEHAKFKSIIDMYVIDSLKYKLEPYKGSV